MIRPTLNELLAGFQRTTMTILLPELSSPYAQGQALAMIGMLSSAQQWLAAAPRYDAEEVKDLAGTFAALKRIGARHIPRTGPLRKALTAGVRAAAKRPPDRRAMEAALSEFASALALGELHEAAARTIRPYLNRYLTRTRTLLARDLPL